MSEKFEETATVMKKSIFTRPSSCVAVIILQIPFIAVPYLHCLCTIPRCYSFLINKHRNHNTLSNLIRTYKWKNFIIRITLTVYHIIHHCHENRPLIKEIYFMLFGNKISKKKSPKVITRLIVLGIRDLRTSQQLIAFVYKWEVFFYILQFRLSINTKFSSCYL